MTPIIPALTISISLLVFYILLTFWYRSYLNKIEIRKSQERKERQLDRYITKEKKDEMRKKLDQISNIIRDTERSLKLEIKNKVKATKSQISLVDNESLIIEQAEKEYLIHSAGFSSAMPKTEEDLQIDIENLEESIRILESLDEDYYSPKLKKIDIGKGMFYEKIARRLQRIIEEQQLAEFKIIPIQRLKYHALKDIKNLKDNDFLPILNTMKETELIRDLIEVNPKFHIIVLSDNKYEFSNPEKVILTFAYEKESLTIEELLEITEWDFTYASQVLNELFGKELASITDDKIIIEGFGSDEEREKWNNVISKYIEQEQIKLEQNRKKKETIKLSLQEKLKDLGEDLSIKEGSAIKKEKKDYIIESGEEFDKEFEKVPQIRFKDKPKVKQITDLKKIRAIYEETPEEVSDEDLKKLISQTILSFHEKYSLLNGGFVQFKKLSNFIYEDIEDASDEFIQETINKLIELKLIHEKFDLQNQSFYTFKEIQLDSLEREFITFALNKKPMNKDDFIDGLSWDEEKVLSTMKHLQSKGILRIEKDVIIIPGILQME